VSNQKIYDDGFLQIIGTPRGPHVYIAGARVHHWVAGAVLSGLGLSGLLLDKKKERRPWYFLCVIFGGLLVLDDLPDFISFLHDTVGS